MKTAQSWQSFLNIIPLSQTFNTIYRLKNVVYQVRRNRLISLLCWLDAYFPSLTKNIFPLGIRISQSFFGTTHRKETLRKKNSVRFSIIFQTNNQQQKRGLGERISFSFSLLSAPPLTFGQTSENVSHNDGRRTFFFFTPTCFFFFQKLLFNRPPPIYLSTGGGR